MRYSVNFLAVIIILQAIAGACKPKNRVLKSPPGYDFSKGMVDKLDIKLKEISGIVWDNVNDEFIAHQDERGLLFFLDRESKIIKGQPFEFDAKKGDYEDIAIVKGVIYVLKSDGSLTKVYTDSTGKRYGVEAGSISLSGVNDFESLYYDPQRNALIMICKNCQSDNKKTVSAYAEQKFLPLHRPHQNNHLV